MEEVSVVRIDNLSALDALCSVLAEHLPVGFVIGLRGPLGVGKTQLVRSLLSHLGHTGTVPSPTFVLETRYELVHAAQAVQVYHWDLYRIASEQTPEDLLDCTRDPQGITLVEWPERVATVRDLLDIELVLAFDTEEAQVEQVSAEQLARHISFAAKAESKGYEVLREFLAHHAVRGEKAI